MRVVRELEVGSCIILRKTPGRPQTPGYGWKMTPQDKLGRPLDYLRIPENMDEMFVTGGVGERMRDIPVGGSLTITTQNDPAGLYTLTRYRVPAVVVEAKIRIATPIQQAVDVDTGQKLETTFGSLGMILRGLQAGLVHPTADGCLFGEFTFKNIGHKLLFSGPDERDILAAEHMAGWHVGPAESEGINVDDMLIPRLGR